MAASPWRPALTPFDCESKLKIRSLIIGLAALRWWALNVCREFMFSELSYEPCKERPLFTETCEVKFVETIIGIALELDEFRLFFMKSCFGRVVTATATFCRAELAFWAKAALPALKVLKSIR